MFKGMPLLQYSRILASGRKQPQTLFRLFFLMSKNQAHKLQNGSLGDPKITKKTRKMRSGMECGKDWKKTLKNRSPGTLKIMVLLRKVAKKTTSTLLQKTPEIESKISSKRLKIHKIPFWAQGRKDNKKKHKKQHELYQKASPKGEPRTWSSHP